MQVLNVDGRSSEYFGGKCGPASVRSVRILNSGHSAERRPGKPVVTK